MVFRKRSCVAALVLGALIACTHEQPPGPQSIHNGERANCAKDAQGLYDCTVVKPAWVDELYERERGIAGLQRSTGRKPAGFRNAEAVLSDNAERAKALQKAREELASAEARLAELNSEFQQLSQEKRTRHAQRRIAANAVVAFQRQRIALLEFAEEQSVGATVGGVLLSDIDLFALEEPDNLRLKLLASIDSIRRRGPPSQSVVVFCLSNLGDIGECGSIGEGREKALSVAAAPTPPIEASDSVSEASVRALSFPPRGSGADDLRRRRPRSFVLNQCSELLEVFDLLPVEVMQIHAAHYELCLEAAKAE
ncbi:MAG: hypothetical protein AAGH68_02250 [Pseudomonadota bacterium]